MIVAHGGDGQDAAGPKGLVKHPVVHLPAFAGSRRGKGCGNADPLGGAAPPASDLAGGRGDSAAEEEKKPPLSEKERLAAYRCRFSWTSVSSGGISSQKREGRLRVVEP